MAFMYGKIKENVFPLVTSWIITIAFDFFLHGGLLANLYTQKSPFLLSAENAFQRIPLGYLSFLILCFLLLWLVKISDITNKKDGFIFGLKFGLLAWGAFVLGLYSISTASIDLLLGWWIGQSLELALAGYVMGAYFEKVTPKKIILGVIVFLIVMIILTILLQVVGFATPMKTV
jgi:hypothetical protein